MPQEHCYLFFCFVPVQGTTGPRVFGFAEFIAALALLVVIYTVADVRYKFRLAITPGKLYSTTFGLIAFIGFATLLTEVWLAEGWWVPKTALTRFTWQALLGAMFLGTFLTWMYYAFIRPPIFNRVNAKRYAQTIYRVILKGSDVELPVIADELTRSAAALVKYSRRHSQVVTPDPAKPHKANSTVHNYAHDLLLLIGNRKLCRHIVESSPVVAMAFLDAMAAEKKFDIPLSQFAKNITTEAIADKDSILYHETDGYSSGLIGYVKQWSQSLYGNFAIVEGLAGQAGSPLDVDYQAQYSWDSRQWNAYCRAVLIALRAYLATGRTHIHSYAIYRALNNVEAAFRDLHTLDNSTEALTNNDVHERLNVAVDFVKKAVRLIDTQNAPPTAQLRRQGSVRQRDIYDHLAKLIFEIIFAASHVSAPPRLCWSIHHNAVWGDLFETTESSPAWGSVRFKVRRLLYDEVVRLEKFPNYKSAPILGLLLNVMGLNAGAGKTSYGREYRPLAKAVRAWVKRCYLKLQADNEEVADACLIGSISFDKDQSRLVKTYFRGLKKEPPREYLDLDRPVCVDNGDSAQSHDQDPGGNNDQ